MAGRPKLRAEMVMLGEHEDAIFDKLDAGMTHGQIAAELGVMRSSLTRWLNANAERKQLLAESRTHAAEGLAEESLEIADACKGLDNAEVQAARLKIDTRMRIASVWNPQRFSEKQAGVVVNIGSLHLEALRQAQAATPVELAQVHEAASASPLPAPDSSESGILDVEVREVRAGDAFGLM